MIWLGAVSACWWLLQGLLLVVARRRVPPVSSLPEASLARWPPVSIICPARDEGAAVKDALETKLAEGYPSVQVVLVDDRSTDDTGACAREVAANDPRVTVARVDALPEGWLGKVNAMRVGLEAARGEWVLFSDADVHLAPGTLARVVAWAEQERADHVAIIPSFHTPGPGAALALSSFFRLFPTLALPWKAADPRSKVSFGVGAFNLVRRAALDRTPGLEWLKLDIADDAALGLMLKRSGAAQRVLVGREAVSLEFYPSVRAVFVALEKNGATAPLPPLLLVGALLLVLELGWLGWAWAAPGAAVVALLLNLLTQWLTVTWLKLARWPALVPGVGALLLVAAIWRSGALALVRGGVRWRGTLYRTAVIRAGARIGPTARR